MTERGATETGPVVEARDLRKRWGRVVGLDGVSLRVARGEVVAVLGPSGSGKSTLLRCLNGLELPDQGEAFVAGRRILAGAPHIDAARARIGMVFQAFHLFPHLTALGNAALAPRIVGGLSQVAAEDRARAALADVGLEDRAAAMPEELSGGQKQRVAIARVLAMDPQVILFDEPTSALDPETVGEVLAVMAELARRGTTMIAVTHEIAFARDAATRIVFMDRGRIEADGPAAALLASPTCDRLRTFLARTGGGSSGVSSIRGPEETSR